MKPIDITAEKLKIMTEDETYYAFHGLGIKQPGLWITVEYGVSWEETISAVSDVWTNVRERFPLSEKTSIEKIHYEILYFDHQPSTEEVYSKAKRRNLRLATLEELCAFVRVYQITHGSLVALGSLQKIEGEDIAPSAHCDPYDNLITLSDSTCGEDDTPNAWPGQYFLAVH